MHETFKYVDSMVFILGNLNFRNIFIKTKRDAAYPNPTVDMPTSPTSVANPVERRPEVVCNCRENRYIQCIVPR